MKRNILFVALIGIVFHSFNGIAQENKSKKSRPNIILILSDDMGYSDLGCYGGEIKTPNLDDLANGGLRYIQFYNTSRCCPSRASLMTGLYPHQAGMGWMSSHPRPGTGYAAELNNECVTIAEVLKQAGYSTYMTGKWHLCKKDDAIQGAGPNPKDHDWPLQRGFDKFYGILAGAANYYDPGTLCRGNKLISPLNDKEYQPKNYYFTDAISDNSVKFIEERDKEKPFFMYVAYTTAHWPMQAPEDEIEKNKGRYNAGYEAIRNERFAKMKDLGLIPKNSSLSAPDAEVTSWANETEKPAMTRRMETYAAMINVMDTGIGRIIQKLKADNLYDNTVILFLQDNGACHELVGAGALKPLPRAENEIKLLPNEIQVDANPGLTRTGEQVMEGKQVMAGPANTYISYMRPWANVSNTPFRMYKHWVYEGGISTPLIVHWPNGIKGNGEVRNQVGHEIDVMPTLVELANAKYPETYKGNKITPEAGVSLVPTFANKSLATRNLFWEHEMNKAVRSGKWKLVCRSVWVDGKSGEWKHYKSDPWELYNIEEDRAELHNLATEMPDTVLKMSKLWDNWAHKSKVLPAPWADISENNPKK